MERDVAMTKQGALDAMGEIVRRQAYPGGDCEIDHCEADDILCDRLETLGEKELVALFKKIDKWYA